MIALDDLPVADIQLDKADVINAARESPDFLAGLAMPEIFSFNWPPLFLAVWAWLREEVALDRAFQKLALGLPRGFGKTTMVKLFVLYVILFTNRKFILIVSVTGPHAKNIIADIADMLDDSNIKTVFGDWRLGLETAREDLKKFGFRGRTIIIAGIGAEGSVRGLNIKNARPDVMIFEDIQGREVADSLPVSENLYKWLLGTAMKAKSPHGCLTLFIANMYPTPHSILKKLKKNPQWVKFIAGGILADGTSLWEDLQPINQLLDEYENDLASGHPEIFYAEVLNDENASLNNLVDLSKLPIYRFDDTDLHQGSFIIIDPSNDKANSDAVTLAYFEVHDVIPCVIEIDEGRYSPYETVMQALRLASRKNCRVIAIESNAYQYSLKFWCEFVSRQLGIEGVHFVEVYSGTLSKNTRILTMFKGYVAGEILVHPSCKAQVDMQITGFNPLRKDNVDGILDLLAYAQKVQEMYADIISLHTIQGMQEFLAVDKNSYTAIQNSCF